MITPQTPVELWREADRKIVWQGSLADYFIEYEVKDPRAVLGAVEALRATGKHPHLGGIGFVLRVAGTVSVAHLVSEKREQ